MTVFKILTVIGSMEEFILELLFESPQLYIQSYQFNKEVKKFMMKTIYLWYQIF